METSGDCRGSQGRAFPNQTSTGKLVLNPVRVHQENESSHALSHGSWTGFGAGLGMHRCVVAAQPCWAASLATRITLHALRCHPAQSAWLHSVPAAAEKEGVSSSEASNSPIC